MNCPRCQAIIAPEARFCANCGRSLVARPERGFVPGIIVGAAALGLALLALNFAGALNLRGSAQIVAPKMRAEPTPPVIQRAPGRMPDDVRAWLEHLARIEERRMDTARAQISGLLISMEEIKGAELGSQLSDLLGGDPTQVEQTEAPSVSKARDIAAKVRPDWEALSRDFADKKPPQECESIAAEYEQALKETGATVSDIIEVINTLGGDPQQAVTKLQSIMANHKKMIDEPAKRADEGVASICEKYSERKWFTIRGDVGGGGMFAMPSALGGGF